MAHPTDDPNDADKGLPQPDTPPIPPPAKPDNDKLLPQPDTPPIGPS